MAILQTEISHMSYDWDENLRIRQQQYEEGIQEMQIKVQKSEDSRNEIMQTMLSIKNELCSSQLQFNELNKELSMAKVQIEEQRSLAEKAVAERDALKKELAASQCELDAVSAQLQKTNVDLAESQSNLLLVTQAKQQTEGELQATKLELQNTKEQFGQAEARLNYIQKAFSHPSE